ncbi:DUF934 domain-containing protein [Wenxinia saemankumensis]|uniref:Oxidoreductase n=1 Tax=Wenxinia saemankumensis TaxID=1447782 RepID=A0A1M6AMN2_9RHOB|nr:DUF934 domain-containing protein [Wenxinia saemankumensis]SHI37667.1 protein of unknown function [Wenxinia saemankumensis]
MSVIVTDAGFGPDTWEAGFVPLDEIEGDPAAMGIDLASDTPPARLAELTEAGAVRIDFPSFSDGRGFTLARLLRLAGFAGRLRAHGHVIADQYAMARRSGFDEVEIPDDLAARQPEAQWRARADWQAHDYQSRLRASA